MLLLIFFTLFSIILSLTVDARKTLVGFKRGMGMFFNLLPVLLVILIIVSALLYFIPQNTIVQFLGARSGILGVLIAALVGAIALIPPFIAFPLANILLAKGVGYGVVAVFITTLIMVGFVTLPIEIRYFGKKAAFWRNLLSFLAALIIGTLVGAFM
ncbi:permease [Candidatus Saganbacteria bacterium]|nr:permease [Candidatus Saganbacteria bacterium]